VEHQPGMVLTEGLPGPWITLTKRVEHPGVFFSRLRPLKI